MTVLSDSEYVDFFFSFIREIITIIVCLFDATLAENKITIKLGCRCDDKFSKILKVLNNTTDCMSNKRTGFYSPAKLHC